MQIKKAYKNVVCIYCIQNKITGKKYIGKTINLQSRLYQHRYGLTRDVLPKGINPHLYNSCKKYGINNFEISIIEYFKNNVPDKLSKREIYWIKKLDTINPEKGYNISLNSSSTKIVTEDIKKLISRNIMGENNPNWGNNWTAEQKLKLSNLKKQMFLEGVHNKQNITFVKNHFAKLRNEYITDPEKLKRIMQKVSKTRTKYHIYQYSKDMKLIKKWYTMFELLEQNPLYKRHNIYAVCSGEKKTMYGFIWKKIKI